MIAFGELSTTRIYAGGPIPIDKIVWYAKELELEPLEVELFREVMLSMDLVYLEHMRKEQKAKGKEYERGQSSAAHPTPRRPRTPRARRR